MEQKENENEEQIINSENQKEEDIQKNEIKEEINKTEVENKINNTEEENNINKTEEGNNINKTEEENNINKTEEENNINKTEEENKINNIEETQEENNVNNIEEGQEENKNNINNEITEEKETENIENNNESEPSNKENNRYPEEKVEENKVEEKEENEEKSFHDENESIKDSIYKIQNTVPRRKLPKILNKNFTEATINQINTTISDHVLTKESSDYTIMRNKIENFCHPKIRNQHYFNMKSLDNVFKTKKLMFEQNKKINKKKNLTEKEKELEQLEELRKLQNPITLTREETKKYLQLYNCREIEENIEDLKLTSKLKDYKSTEFNTTRYSEYNAFKIFYSKMRKDNEIIRKGGENIKTPSFNLIRATKKFNAVPNPIGVVKRKGDMSKMELKNKLVGDKYVRCLCESLEVSDHLSEINLSKNRLSDISIIPLFKTLTKNIPLLKQIKLIDLSFNKIAIAATELICQFILEIDCNLEHLNLESNNLGNNNANKIINAIHTNLDSKIRYLNLAQNILDDEIALELSILIKKCEYLTVLILYQNQLRNQGGGLLMNEIKNHNRLKILDLSWNLIGTNLTDEIPTLDELTKASTNPNSHFDNAYLNELKYTMQFRRQGSLSPVRVGSKVSYFTNQLCELFHNKSSELIHLDISYNNINFVDSSAISENIKDNHTILGIHVDGNDMWVDELGFVHPVEKNKYKQNHFAQSQIFYRIASDHPLSRSNVINVQKLRSKNNCWICEGWREIKFHYKPNKYEGDLDSAYVRLHLNFENYKSYDLRLIDDSFVIHRMCPPGLLNFFLTMNSIPVDNYGPITHELKDAIIYTQEKKPKQFEDEEDDEEEKEPKKFIITKVAQTNVEINPEVISSEGYHKNIKFCLPRPEKINLKKRPRTPWTFPISIWAYYGYDYNGEPDSVYNNAFEFDYDRCNFIKDKDLSEDDEIDLKNILKSKYKQMIETYKNLSAYLGWKIWQIGQNQITEFVSNCPDLLDKNYLINDVLVKVTEVKSNSLDKNDRKKNQNIPDNIIRHQFMMLLVKVAKDKYFRTKQIPSIVEAVEYSFEHHYDYYLNQFNNHKWRQERYYNEPVDNIIKAHIPIFDALFYSYAPQQIMGRKDSFWLTLEGYTNLCNSLMDSDFPVKELPVLFNLSMRLQTNEIDFDKHYNMVFPEFLEAICRFIDKLSPIPPGEDPSKWDMKRRQEQPLVNKIETMIPQLMKQISGAYKNVRDKFVMPEREEDTGLFKIDYDNPLYEGKIPKRTRRKRIDSSLS